MINAIVKKAFLSLLLVASDVIAILFSFILAFYVRSWLLVDVFPVFPSMFHGIDVYIKAWMLSSLWLVIFYYEGLYPSIGMGFWEETKWILRGNVLAFVILIILTFVTKTTVNFSRSVIVFAFLFSVILLPMMRRSIRSALIRSGLWKKDVLIIGLSGTVKQILCNLKKHPDWGLHPIGVVLPDWEDQSDSIRLPVYSRIENVSNSPVKAEEIIVAMPHLSRVELVEVVESSMKIAPVVKILPDLYGITSAGVKTHDLDGMLLLEMVDRLSLKRNSAVKRAFDFICSLMGIIFLLPVFLILMLMIKLDSSGPVFFGHKRLGKGGKHFICYKFRTMLPNAQIILRELLEKDPKARSEWEKDFKLKNDPRVTRIGSFLRRTSLDELPQLWNVIRGEMSLVGPRPIVTDEVEKYGERSRYLFRVPPGITGLWQVSGRNDLDYEERILLDEYYTKNWSLWLDLEVIIRTFGAIMKKEGAY